MIFYGYIFASVLKYNLYFWSERRAYYSASLFVGFSQLLLVFAILLMMKYMAGIDWVTWFFESGPYLFIFVMIGWLVALSYYYTLDRVDRLQEKLAEKPKVQRIMWGVIAILSFVTPMALLYVFSPAK